MQVLESPLPTFDEALARIEAAERAEGWLGACVDAGRYLCASRPFVVALAGVLEQLVGPGSPGAGRVLEVCAGRGELAEALQREGVSVIATDLDPPDATSVPRASAAEALRAHRPAVVIGAFVPCDSQVDRQVMACSSVRHYLVLGARIGGQFGSPALGEASGFADPGNGSGWTARRIEAVDRWMLTRHDVWLPAASKSLLRHGEVWHFTRKELRRV